LNSYLPTTTIKWTILYEVKYIVLMTLTV